MKNVITRRLAAHKSAQCYVTITDDCTHFISYRTLVCAIDQNGWLICTGTYSPTTRRQIGWFLKEYAPMVNYQMVKQAYNDNMAINIHTGEIVPL